MELLQTVTNSSLSSDSKKQLTQPGTDEHVEVAPGASGHVEVAPGALGQVEVAPGASGQVEVAPGASGQVEVAPEASGQVEDAPGASGQVEVAPGASGQVKVAPGASGQKEAERDIQEVICEKIQQARLFWEAEKSVLSRRNLATLPHYYHIKDFRSSEMIRQLSNDQELADATVRMYVSYFNFTSMSINVALRFFLRVLWPEDEIQLQHLFIRYFSLWYLKRNKRSLYLHQGVYNLCWAMIILNADLNGGQKERKKMTCEEFIDNLNSVSGNFNYSVDLLKHIYKSIKMNPLHVCRVKSRLQDIEEKSNTKVHKTGHLMCKRVMDENGRKTIKYRRSWKSFNAVLKGMVLHIDGEELHCKNITISLHHAVAYPLEYKNKPHVLYLKTADSRVFYFQADSEVERRLWVATINLIAARYSAPPLTSYSNTKTHCPQVLPTFSSRLPLERQLEYTKDQLQKVSEYMSYYKTVPFRKDMSPSDYIEQEVKRYTTYARALEKPVRDSNLRLKEVLLQK
ncbi:PH and SEC7 domain-containing protein 3-like isoform X1 [Silurus meridionalis]|uniref:PH and SEC7 domain-containing protein 3-like isoform X1 n=2 Tax=Silurus meridionalis TaxID=175797 RepID=UPI001EEB686D|nr:PH and SEC7 domain-containing protein 3-like isoform X1 [Silurus meridionalis]XP_046698655.1 PH and SEC7 domain-containing protein 3-like isoform X1 [Silurus meridionalis]